MHIYLPFSLVLFLAGASTAFFLAFKYVLNFLFSFNAAMKIDPDPRISEWLGFVLLLPVAFGISFQLPLVMLFLYRVGIFSLQVYLSKWRLAVLIIFVAAMVITPTADPITMLLMALPMTGLYFLGIALCKWMPQEQEPVLGRVRAVREMQDAGLRSRCSVPCTSAPAKPCIAHHGIGPGPPTRLVLQGPRP